ncbi:MAG: hypothetical protein WB791_07320 [Waddliaceae bacterium]
MKRFTLFFRLFSRFRYPVALPEDVAKALGICLCNSLAFDEFVHRLTRSSCRSKRLIKFMPRQEAEKAFIKAQRKERFGKNTLFSYYFTEGWLEFDLQFDSEARLRRLYVQHCSIKNDHGIEIQLSRQ